MKLYPIYEFPPDREQLFDLLNWIDNNQPVLRDNLFDYVHSLYGKRKSRTEITVRNLVSLGLLKKSGNSLFLSHETQMYINLDRDIAELLLHLIHKSSQLFTICKDICDIDLEFKLSNPDLLDELWNAGYTRERLSTAREKIYAIKRLIKCCRQSELENPFLEYERYRNFLKVLEAEYLQKVKNGYGEPVPINYLIDRLKGNHGYSLSVSNEQLERLYNDAYFANVLSFTTVNKEFARYNYFRIDNKLFYFVKVLSTLKVANLFDDLEGETW